MGWLRCPAISQQPAIHHHRSVCFGHDSCHDRKLDHARRTICGLAGGRFRRDAGKHRSQITRSYGALISDATLGKNYVIGIDATVATDPVIACKYLHLSEHRSKCRDRLFPCSAAWVPSIRCSSRPTRMACCSPICIRSRPPASPPSSTAGRRSISASPANGESVEVAIPQALLTPSGGAAPTSINFAALIDNGVACAAWRFRQQPAIRHHRSLDSGPGQHRHQEGRNRLFRDHCCALFRRRGGWRDGLFRFVHGGAASGGSCRRLL